jgi:hypothetical protein
MTDEIRRKMTEYAERVLTPDEFEAALALPVSDEEWAEKRALIRWFVTRYPTPAERLAYVRRAAMNEWRPKSPGSGPNAGT